MFLILAVNGCAPTGDELAGGPLTPLEEDSGGMETGDDVGPETCNGLDDDRDGEVDEEASDAVPVHPDSDGDGYGDMNTVATRFTTFRSRQH